MLARTIALLGARTRASRRVPHSTAMRRGLGVRSRCCVLVTLQIGTLALPNRDLRQQIQDEAAIEIRDEHGLPRLHE